MKFRSSLNYFLYILRIFGLNCVDLTKSPIKLSKIWFIYSVLVLIGYGYFHVSAAQHDLSARGVNFVTTLIDYYNKYSGLVLFITCILVTLIRQRTLCKVIQLIEEHDQLFRKVQQEEMNYSQHSR